MKKRIKFISLGRLLKTKRENIQITNIKKERWPSLKILLILKTKQGAIKITIMSKNSIDKTKQSPLKTQLPKLTKENIQNLEKFFSS